MRLSSFRQRNNIFSRKLPGGYQAPLLEAPIPSFGLGVIVLWREFKSLIDLRINTCNAGHWLADSIVLSDRFRQPCL
jgi:hypothetical protein